MKRTLLIIPVRKKTSDRFDMAKLAALADTCRSLAYSVESGLGEVRTALGDPSVQAETKALVSELVDASRRARKIGLMQAFGDKQVGRRLSSASRHASLAFAAGRGTRRQRSSGWRKVAVTGGVALTAGSAYVAWKVQAK